MDKLIEAIEDCLKAKVPELQYIDEDWGQMDFYEDSPVKFPCALIEVQNADYSDDGELRQRGLVMVSVKLYFMGEVNSSNLTPEMQKNERRKNWDICKKVNQMLHGQDFLPAGFGTLGRKQMSSLTRNNGIYNRNINYAVAFIDDSCTPVMRMTPASPTIKTVIQNV